MSREQAETTLRQDIEYAWEPWLDKDTIPQSKFSRVIRNALAPNLIGQYKEAALVLLRKFIKEDDIDEDELDELADSAMTKHSAWIAGLVTETTTKWIEDDQNPVRAFSRERAELIAITEITRARTMGEMAAAELLVEVDVILSGTWITMEDELVCEVCGPLHLTPESYWSEFFPNGSPAHVRCRCNIEWKEKAKRQSKRNKQVGRMRKRSRLKKVFSRMRRRSAEEVVGFEVIIGTSLVEGGVGSGITGHTTPRVRRWAAKRFKNPEHAKAFEEWFGDSKVVDENGDPLVVYHGTKTPSFKRSKASLSEDQYQELSKLYDAKDEAGMEKFWQDLEVEANINQSGFNEFSKSKIGSATDAGYAGSGFYFTSDALTAEAYGSVIYPVYLKANKLFDMNGKNFNNVMAEHGGPKGFSEWLHSEGYEGAMLWSQIMVLDPNQIKSATGNRGTFNPASNNINESSAPNSEENLA